MTQYNPKWLCTTCIHFNNDEPATCAAFPHGIPMKVISGENKHRQSLPGDHGIQYEKEK